MDIKMQKDIRKRKTKGYFDYTLLFIVVLLICFGFVMIYSTSSYSASLEYGDNLYYLKQQIISTIIGFAAMAVCTLIPYEIYKKLYWPAIIVAFVSVFLILTPLGHRSHGASRWIYIGGHSIQVAEICKMAVIIFVAVLFAKMDLSIRRSWKGFWFPMVPVGLLCLQILIITNNLSSALIIGLMAVTMLFVGERRNIWPRITYIGIFAVCALVVILVVTGKLPKGLSFRLGRVMAWLNPSAYADDEGYQILQSLYGIGSGGFLGKGLGKSMQKLGFLSEADNDMIYSIICEELGVAGGLAVMLMYVVLLWRIFEVTRYNRDFLGNMIVTGVFSHIAIQVVLNICVATNTIPNTGVSLPFISYGGSSVIFLLGEIGLVMNVARHAEFAGEEEENNG